MVVMWGGIGCLRNPDFEPPRVDAPAAPKWVAAGEGLGEVEDDWWTNFGQERLTLLVRQAIETNYSLRASAARMEAARAQAGIAGADLAPQANAFLDRNRQKQVIVGIPIPGAGDVLESVSTSARGTLQVSWEADLWGRIRAAELAALADVEARQAELRGARQSIAAETARAWFALIAAHQQVELARATVAAFFETKESVRVRYERGLRQALDFRLAISNLSSAEATLEQRQAELERAVRRLQALLGRYPDGSLEPVDSLPDLPPLPPAGTPADVVRRRPDLVAAERRLAAASAGVIEAESALYPSFALSGSTGFSSNELVDVLTGDFGVWSLAQSLTAPLFQGGRLRAGVDLAEARAEEAKWSFVESVLQAFAEVEAALAAERHLIAQIEELEDNVAQAIAAQDLAMEQYVAGLVDILTLLDSERRAVEAQSRLIEVHRLALDNRVALHLALGGGFETSPPEDEGIS